MSSLAELPELVGFSPEERQAQDEAAALLDAERERERQEAAAEEKWRRKAAEAEAKRRAEQKRQEAKAEAERQAEQRRRREETDAVRRAEEYARQQTAAQRLRSEAEVKPSAEEIARSGRERSEVLPGSSRRAALIAWSLLALSVLAPLGASLASPQLARALFLASDFAVTIYTWVVIVAAIFSWLVALNVINAREQAVRTIGEFLSQITAPALYPIRSFLPNVGVFDISPVILLFFLIFLRYATALYVVPRFY
jgi:YggT family protein